MLQLLDELTFQRNPWREFERFHRDFDRATQAFLRAGERRRAPLNIYRNENQLKVQVRRPGWRAEWFELSVEGNQLHIKGAPRTEDGKINEDAQLSRVVNLPFRVQADAVQARYNKGVLTVDLAKTPEDMPRTIAVQSV